MSSCVNRYKFCFNYSNLKHFNEKQGNSNIFPTNYLEKLLSVRMVVEISSMFQFV